jgi:DDB1- and CUL4-associated factor 13
MLNRSAGQAEASETLGVLLPRQKAKRAYNRALVERYKHMPEVRRISRDRTLPKVRRVVCWCPT